MRRTKEEEDAIWETMRRLKVPFPEYIDCKTCFYFTPQQLAETQRAPLVDPAYLWDLKPPSSSPSPSRFSSEGVNRNGNAPQVKREEEEDSDEECGRRRYLHVTPQYSTKIKTQVWELLKRCEVEDAYARCKGRIPMLTLRRWKERIDSGEPADRKHGGRLRQQFPELEAKVLEWFKTKRAKQLPVRHKDIQEAARRIASELRLDPKFTASNGWLWSFEHRHGLALRQRTRVALRATKEMRTAIAGFFEAINSKIEMYSMNDVWNYDEVGIYFEPNITRTMELKGQKAVSILSLKAQSMRMTVILFVSASGTMAPPVLLYYNKGFVSFTLDGYPDTLIVSNQRGYNVEPTNYSVVLPHFLKYMKDGSLLIIDECSGHKSPRIEQLLASHGITSVRIPGGATCLLQPVDSNVGKIVKSEVKAQFIRWCNEHVDEIVAPEGRRTKGFKRPTNQMMAAWVMEGIKKVRPENIRNSFHNTGIISKEQQRYILNEKLPRYYVNNPEPPPTPVAVKIDNDVDADADVATNANANANTNTNTNANANVNVKTET